MIGWKHGLGPAALVALGMTQPAAATVSLVRITAQVDPFANLYTERGGFVQDDGLDTRQVTTLQSIDLTGSASATSGGATAGDTARVRFDAGQAFAGTIAIDLALTASLLKPTDQVQYDDFGQLIYRFKVDTVTPFTIDYASSGAAAGTFSFTLRSTSGSVVGQGSGAGSSALSLARGTYDLVLSADYAPYIKGAGQTVAGFGGTARFLIGSPVPEPASWAMIITGFLAVGAAMRRQRRRTYPTLRSGRAGVAEPATAA